MTPSPAIDIHQHLWPPELIDALRARRHAPRLVGWTLHLVGEPPYDIDPVDHRPAERRSLDDGRIVLGLSSPLGIEDLPPVEAETLLRAWHDGAAALQPDFDAWASIAHLDPDLDDLTRRLVDGFVGLQIPATWMSTPASVEALAPALEICAAANRPVFVHPGPVPSGNGSAEVLPAWWAAVVDYPSQLIAAWWSWQAAGRALAPELRICFAAGAGLAPVHHERFLARGGHPLVVNDRTFVDTSSYSRQGVDSLIRVLGVDPIVVGSDRPYGVPFHTDQGDAAIKAFRHTNPLRLLEGPRS
jgi:predicted TIM-barrel fold metal-dependent hydrolase